MALPNLIFASTSTAASQPQGVTLAVYAPFGTDAVLSTYPDGTSLTLAQHPLVVNLQKVSEAGVHVCALIDLYGGDTWLVEITADKPGSLRLTSRWKHDMDAPNNLSGFLRYAQQSRPGTALVVAFEGHGAGFLPDIDVRQLTAANLTKGGTLEWEITKDQGAPVLPMGAPLLPMGAPLLPMGAPLLPVNHMPLSTWALGKALKDAVGTGRKVGVIHFNNCFNMSVELLHTVAPHAEYATGYINYNFFTAGATYPAVFQKLKLAGSATTAQLAGWFADANHTMLAAKGGHPTVGGVVQLSRMAGIATAVDTLAKALIVALTTAPAALRPSVVGKIRMAIALAQQYDTVSGQQLEAPDELTDLCSLAAELRSFDVNPAQVQAAATALQTALNGIKRYGANDRPWTAPTVTWNFTRPTLAMNILCPDPLLRGLWDWRSPYYLQTKPELGIPVVQPNVIDFLKNTAWVPFLIEYHKDAPFKGLLPPAIPEYPVFNAKFKPTT
jgi:hypothetical protein